MCGIAGIFHSNPSQATLVNLKGMTDALVHRGPDGYGEWQSASQHVVLGHRRLSIIDLSNAGHQPMSFRHLTITFNGEIYNYLELKKELLEKGYQFKSNSDTEVLLMLYHLKGAKCLEDLDGMFAFAIWDEQKKELFCARDRFGEKPFYYAFKEDKYFYFASEMKALWAVGISKENDPVMLNRYLTIGTVTSETQSDITFYKDIKQLDASNYLQVNQSLKISITRYYDIKVNINQSISEKQAIEQFTELFKNSVNIRLRSDVPVGSSLSGGLDSSSIVMMIDKLKGNTTQQNTFSARFTNFDKDEGKHIHAVVNACKNIKAHEVFPNGNEMQNVFSELLYHQEEPFASASIFAQWKVMELAKQNDVVVLLDGQGADEYLAGYLHYYNNYFKQLFFTNKTFYKQEFKKYKDLRGNIIGKVEDEETIRMKIGRVKRKLLKQPMPYNDLSLDNELKKHVLNTGLKELLRYADRNAMAHSREVRLPFLSHKLVDFVFTLPTQFKLKDGWTKYILRKSMEPILPKGICWRIDKIGYEPPQQNWIDSEYWREQVELGKKKYKQINTLPNSERSDWQYLMINSYVEV